MGQERVESATYGGPLNTSHPADCSKGHVGIQVALKLSIKEKYYGLRKRRSAHMKYLCVPG